MRGRITAVYQYRDPRVDDAYYSSDEFRMFGFKILPCPRTRSHDWTDCPLAHRGEKAQRRDPSVFNYMAIACPNFKANDGECPLGEACCFAHGIFEYWLHPAKYRTRPCHMGHLCQRKVCFFAHGPHQLRTEIKYKVQWSNNNSLDGVTQIDSLTGLPIPKSTAADGFDPMKPHFDSNSRQRLSSINETEVTRRLGELSVVEGIPTDAGFACLPNLPEIDWVSQLLDDENIDW
uniref:C3H1-type domain-containing protein n=1 Tax=Kalanchoe fedtschenkoi TaxID=63787 RepID=A0A7N0TIV0_KALFE